MGGQVLNGISEFTMNATKDFMPNALVENVDGNVVVQKKMKNLMVEFIVRGYLWGSMAAAYEKGDREFCGLKVPEGLIRFKKFDEPLYTPTTKAEVGHDENMTEEEVEKFVGKDMAKQAKDAALRMFARGQELMKSRGLILIDTKYEFGLDENGKLHVIDEVNTPDSSRLCDITELSKQYVRDALLEMGFDPVKAKEAPKLSEDQVVECAYRYIKIYERITAKPFSFPETMIEPSKRILMNLQRTVMAQGCFVAIMAGSDSDMPHLENISKELAKFGIPNGIRICSAHKQPARLEALLEQYNKSVEPTMIVGCAGGTD